jgi:histone deacetylase 11
VITNPASVALVHASGYDIDLGGLEQIHPFDVHKYSRIRQQLVGDGVAAESDFCAADEVRSEEVLLVHTPAFVDSLREPKRIAEYLAFPVVGMLPSTVVEQGILGAFRRASGGTVLAARLALEHGIAINLGGGYHHATPSRGDGFCIYADVPIAIRLLQREGRLKRAMIVDLDVHQGNGSILCCRNDASVFTFSMHEKNIYPIPKEKGCLDIELEPNTADRAYLELLGHHLPEALDDFQPDLVFLIAGCDTLGGDPLAHLAMTREGIVQRDQYVVEQCLKRKIPVTVLLGGGYSPEAWRVQYASVRGILDTFGRKTPRLHEANPPHHKAWCTPPSPSVPLPQAGEGSC